MFALYFNPTGQISSREFRKGAIILLALNYALWLTWYVGFGMAVIGSGIAMISIFCWACLFLKRLRHSGVSEVYYIAIVANFLFALVIIFPVLLNVIMPISEESLALSTQLMEANATLRDIERPTVSEITPVIDLLVKSSQLGALRSAIIFFLSGASIAFGLDQILNKQSALTK